VCVCVCVVWCVCVCVCVCVYVCIYIAKATVGLMLNDLVIHTMVVGGPAYKCKQLEVGDEIIRYTHTHSLSLSLSLSVSLLHTHTHRVDGVQVSSDRFEEFQKALIGDDIPGSTCTLTVRKKPQEGILMRWKKQEGLEIEERCNGKEVLCVCGGG
jgi:hypothetical protein